MQRIINIDSQILNSIQNCARKTKYTFIDHLQPTEKAEPLEKGDLLHFMLEVYYGLVGNCINWKSDTWSSILDWGNGPSEILTRAGNKELACKFAVENGRLHSGTLAIPIETCEEVIYHFTEYCNHFQNDSWSPLAVEEVGSKILFEDEELKIIYSFKIDMIAENGLIKAPWDHKSSSRRQTPTSLSNQFIGYCYALNLNNIVVNKIGFQKTLKPAERFQRDILTIDQDRINEWITNSIYWIRLLDYHIANDSWPMNLTSCDKYSGCIYRSLCESNPSSREWKAERDFKIGQDWDVASILEAK